MLTAYVPDDGRLRTLGDEDTRGLAAAVWIDLLAPTPEEEHAVEAALGVELPTHEEMVEIEVSSRLYVEDDAAFMTATLLSRSETESPEVAPVTFILAPRALVTVRYANPRPFAVFVQRARRARGEYASADAVLVGLLDALLDRTADILERIAASIDGTSRHVFAHEDLRPTKTRDFQDVLRRIGYEGGLMSNARESLVSIGRLLGFLSHVETTRHSTKELRARIKTLSRDAHALTDHASFLSGKINFLLDATLGMINIEQNAIIKIFSVAAVAFLPPTLVASIYGMNFRHMPELDWLLGYPASLVLMVISAVVPFVYFKRRGWL